MTEERLVECQDCGYRWESSATSPRCSKADCGRSRNVEPVEDLSDGDQSSAEEPGNGDGSENGQESSTKATGDQDGGDGDGYTPRFKSRNQRVDQADEQSDWSADDWLDQDDEQDGDQDDGEAEIEADDIPEIEPEQLAPAIDATFQSIADRRGDHWELRDPENRKHEKDRLAEAYAPLINHYAPVIFREYSHVGVAVIVTASVVGPKLAEDKELQKRAEQEEQAEGTEPEPDEAGISGEAEIGEETEVQHTTDPEIDQTDDIGAFAHA